MAGKTGTGKTTFAKKVLFPQYTRRIFWDVKIENNDLLPVCALCTNPHELTRAITQGKVSILYQPAALDIFDFDQVCEIVFDFGNFTLFVDDPTSLYQNASIIAPWHNQIMIRGRSRGVGCVNIVQRPRLCHNTIISESEHFFIFRLQLDTDISKVRQIVPREHLMNIHILPYFHSLYLDTAGEVKYLRAIRDI